MKNVQGIVGVLGSLALLVAGCHGAATGDAAQVVIAVDDGTVPVLEPGEQLTLHASTSGLSSITYAWTISGESATAVGATNAPVFVLAAAPMISSEITFAVTVTCTGKDGQGNAVSVMDTLTINGRPGFHPAADQYTVDEDKTLSIAAPGLVANDTDGDGSDLLVAVLTAPAHGKLTLDKHGGFTYLGDKDFNGADKFTYVVTTPDGAAGQATVSLTVQPVNDAPTAIDHATHLDEDTPLMLDVPGVLDGALDVDGDVIHARVVSSTTHGTLLLSDNGSFTYTPQQDYNGPDSFTFVAFDDHGGVSEAHTVSLTIMPVNDAPVAVADAYSTAEDTTLTVNAANGLLKNDHDVDGDTMTASIVALPTHGTLTLQGTGAFTYVPAANYNGADSFTYKASDGAALSDVTTVTITVNAAEDPPVAANDSYSTAENAVLTVGAPGVLGNDSDPDGDALNAVVVSQPTHGTLTLHADGSFVYTPDLNYFGNDSFLYEPNDGTTDGNVGTVTIKVIPPDNAPVAANDTYSVNEDATLTVPAPGVLGNDTDADADPLTAVVVDMPMHGTLTLGADGSFQYHPAANYNGPDTFTYRANDGTTDSNLATVTVNVGAVNDPPVAHNDVYGATQNVTLNVLVGSGVLANDTDVDGDTLTAVLGTGPAHGMLTLNGDGSFTYVPNAGYTGADGFTYHANDGTVDGNTATVTINVAP